MLYLLVLLIILSEAIGMSFLKKYYLTKRLSFLALGLLGYACISLLLVESYKYEGIGIVNVLWSAISVLLITFIGHFCFKEVITRREVSGMSLVIVGVVLLNL